MSLKLILLQSDPIEANSTIAGFSALGCEIAALARHPRQILELVQLHQPDAVIMDAFLPGSNCDSIARLLTYSYEKPLVKLAFGSCRNDTLAYRFMDQGGDHFIITPPDYSHCMKLISSTLDLRKKQTEALPTPVRLCTEKYQTLMGVPPAMKGYWYIQDGIALATEHPTYLQNLTTALYPAIGIPYRASGTAVERGIRAAIDHTFEHGDLALLEQYFGAYIRSSSGKTSAGDFLFVLTRMVCRDLGIKM